MDSIPHVPVETAILTGLTFVYEGRFEEARDAFDAANRMAADAGLPGLRVRVAGNIALTAGLVQDREWARAAADVLVEAAPAMAPLMEALMLATKVSWEEPGALAELTRRRDDIARQLQADQRLGPISGDLLSSIDDAIVFGEGRYEDVLAVDGQDRELGHASQPYYRLRALLELGRGEEALGLAAALDTLPWISVEPLAREYYPMRYYQGRAYEMLGDTLAARQAYAEFLEGWGEVVDRMPLFRDAPDRLQTLGGAPPGRR